MDDSIRYLLDLAILLFAAKLFGVAGKKIGIRRWSGRSWLVWWSAALFSAL